MPTENEAVELLRQAAGSAAADPQDYRTWCVELTESLLPEMDPALGRAVARSLQSRGVEMRLGTSAVGPTEGGLVVRGPDGAEETIAADRIVVAVGRRPNTGEPGLGSLVSMKYLILPLPRNASNTSSSVGMPTARFSASG